VIAAVVENDTVLNQLKKETDMNQDTICKTNYKRNLMSMLAITAAAFSLDASAYTGEKFSNEARVNMEEAREIAHKAHPGTITDAELEKEKGGSGLRYSFDIRQDKVIQEVGVDAKTGAILENAPEGKNPD
jgi:uncharacterized membrane protein YkoI